MSRVGDALIVVGAVAVVGVSLGGCGIVSTAGVAIAVLVDHRYYQLVPTKGMAVDDRLNPPVSVTLSAVVSGERGANVITSHGGFDGVFGASRFDSSVIQPDRADGASRLDEQVTPVQELVSAVAGGLGEMTDVD